MRLELARLEDFDKYYELKIEDSNVFWTGWKNKPDYEVLRKFYFDKVVNLKTIKDRRIYLAYENNIIVGYVYIDYVDENTFALSPAISANYQGKGYGKKLIKLAIQEGLNLGFKNMEAYIREDNIASQKCFENNGAIKTNIYNNVYIENKNEYIKMYKYYYTMGR